MAQLTDLYFKLDTLKTLVSVLEKKQEKGVAFTVAINNEANDYGQNVSAWVSQSKEDQQAKKDKFYVGNGKTFWSKDGEFVPLKVERGDTPQVASDQTDENSLPF